MAKRYSTLMLISRFACLVSCLILIALTTVSNLAQNNSDSHYQIIAADGSRERNIQLIQVNTGTVDKLTNFKGNMPTWSPDGEKVASMIYRGGIGNFVILNIQDKTTFEWGVAYTETLNVYAFLWSPDNSTIAMLRCWKDELNSCNIDLLDIQQGTIQLLATNFPQFASVSLSPNFKQIFYLSEDSFSSQLHGYVFDIETGKTNLVLEGKRDIQYVKWSPDSKKLAFSDCLDIWRQCGIYSVNSDGTNLQRLANYRSQLSDYSWSPNSLYIVFSSGNYGYEQAFIVNVDTMEWKGLFVGNLSIRFPQFSPDSNQIAFLSCDRHQSLTCRLYVANIDGTNLRPLTDLTNTLYPPIFAWSPQ